MLAIKTAMLDEPGFQPGFRANSVPLWMVRGDVGYAVCGEGCHGFFVVVGDWGEIAGLFAGVDDCGGEEFRVEVAVAVAV
jgi:hypothetical protein